VVAAEGDLGGTDETELRSLEAVDLGLGTARGEADALEDLVAAMSGVTTGTKPRGTRVLAA